MAFFIGNLDIEQLRNQSDDSLHAYGFRRWNESENPLWLIPQSLYSRIPNGTELETIGGETISFEAGQTDDDHRFGMLAYGFRQQSKRADPRTTERTESRVAELEQQLRQERAWNSKLQTRLKMLAERWISQNAVRLLADVEWVVTGREGVSVCLFCHQTFVHGHTSDCEAFGERGVLPPDVRAALHPSTTD